ncbi:hypothetical protein [Plantactinospora sp. CA-290183]|uniref:hypothetical protein n=1 Tax=Plantactinospora sp. CA-290183 TaxID=3240006 RepID=UPI003D8F159F
MAFRRRGRPDREAVDRLLDSFAGGPEGPPAPVGEPDPTAPEGGRAGVGEPDPTAPEGGRAEAREPAPARPGWSPQPPGDAPEPLVAVLRAAAAAPRPGELDGEQAALAAFREARSGNVPSPAPGRRRRITAGAGAWIAVAATTLTAGAALAAETLVPRDEKPPPPAPTSAAPARTGAPGSEPSATGASTAVPGTSGAASPGATRGDRGRSPAPSLAGLCRAHLAGNGGDRGGAGDSAAFTALAKAAGGRANVDAYCRKILAEKPEPGPPPSDRVPERDDRPGQTGPHPPGLTGPHPPPGSTGPHVPGRTGEDRSRRTDDDRSGRDRDDEGGNRDR